MKKTKQQLRAYIKATPTDELQQLREMNYTLMAVYRKHYAPKWVDKSNEIAKEIEEMEEELHKRGY